MGVIATIRSITSSGVTPSLSAVKLNTRRCRKHGLGQRLHVLAGDVRAALQQRPGLRAEDQELHRPRPRSPTHLILDEVGNARLAHAGLPHQRQGVADDVVGDRHLADDPLQLQNLGRRQHRLDRVGQRRRRSPHHLELLGEVRILHEHLEHEAVLLGLGQRIGAFLLDRVLRGQHEERIGQRVPHPADRDLPLLHRFQQAPLASSAACG